MMRKSQTASPQKTQSPKKQVHVQPCNHIDMYTVSFVRTYTNILTTTSTCYQCGRVDDGTTLYGCASCGLIGCLDADLLHLPDHFATSNGCCVAVSPHTGILYCWQCQRFTWTGFLESLWTAVRRRSAMPSPERLIAFHKDDSVQRHCVSLRGLHNLGKTCFMNCTLQVVLHNPHLFAFFLGVGHDVRNCKRAGSGGGGGSEPMAVGKKRDVCIACEMDGLFVEMYSGSTLPYAPTKLLYALWSSFKHLAGYEQQDAHEFLVALLYKLHEHLGGRAFGCECVIHKTFSGVLQSSVTCLGCGTCSPVFDPFMDIALDVVPPVGSDTLTLQTCLDRFCAVETLPGGSYVCAACQSTFREAHKQLSIRKPPLTLCFQLKRFGQGVVMTQSPSMSTNSQSSSTSKLLHHVHFPDLFTLTPYLSEHLDPAKPAADGKPTKNLYKLAAVIHHIGDMDSAGHYAAYINQHDTWFKCDDAMVTVVEAAEVYGIQAYMLFYNRVN